MLHSLNDKLFTFFDLETNGLDRSSAILEIGAVQGTLSQLTNKDDNLKIFHSVLYFNGYLNPFAQAVHKIDSSELLNGRAASAALGEFCAFSKDTVLVGHNIVNFDLPVLSYHLEAHGLSLAAKGVLDTRTLARTYLRLPSYRLSVVAQFFNIPYVNAHRALADAKIAAEVFGRLHAYL